MHCFCKRGAAFFGKIPEKKGIFRCLRPQMQFYPPDGAFFTERQILRRIPPENAGENRKEADDALF